MVICGMPTWDSHIRYKSYRQKGMDVYEDVKGLMRHGDLNELLRALWILKGNAAPKDLPIPPLRG